MVTVGVEVDTKAVEAELAQLAKFYSKATIDGAITGAQLVRSTAIKAIQSKSSGEVVTRTTAAGEPYNHIASKEGAAPNTDTGALVNSVQVDIAGSGIRKGVVVGSRLPYAAWLEFGTSKMAARPWLWPSLEQNRSAIRKLIGKEINKITRKHGDL